MTLDEPEAKLITPPIRDLVGELVEDYDKIFVVRVRDDVIPTEIEVVEFDTLMRHFGPVARVQAAIAARSLPDTIGRGLTKAFAPVVRIENAGQQNAVGLLRAGGLILDEASPAAIRIGDVLEPMTRKNDRNGKPILIGPIDWAFLLVTEIEGRNYKMDYYAGRAGGLQGRKNQRTFRTALKVRPFGDSSVLRLHLQRDPDFPLIGYELYDKELKSTKMTFIGRTDWDGRLLDRALRGSSAIAVCQERWCSPGPVCRSCPVCIRWTWPICQVTTCVFKPRLTFAECRTRSSISSRFENCSRPAFT